MWEGVLGDTAGQWPERLAGQFSLNAGEIVAVADAVAPGGTAGEDPPEDMGERAWDACRLRARPRLEGLAQRVVTETRLSDVQLPDRERRLLEQIGDQTRHRVRVYDEYGFRARLSRGS